MVADTAELLALPASGLWPALTVLPYEMVEPYSKVTVAAPPLALTVPLKVLPPTVTVAAPVVTEGAQGAVVKVEESALSDPLLLTAVGLNV